MVLYNMGDGDGSIASGWAWEKTKAETYLPSSFLSKVSESRTSRQQAWQNERLIAWANISPSKSFRAAKTMTLIDTIPGEITLEQTYHIVMSNVSPLNRKKSA